MENEYTKVSRWEKGSVEIGYLSATSVVYLERPGLRSDPPACIIYKDGVAVLCAGWH